MQPGEGRLVFIPIEVCGRHVAQTKRSTGAKPGGTYHQLCRAIPHENSGKIRVDTEGEQQIWSECSRLFTNAVIFYNSCLLSKLL